MPAGTKIYPKIDNTKFMELVGGTMLSVSWPAPTDGAYRLWVQIPPDSTASNAIYRIYTKGKKPGSTICSSTDMTNPCYELTVNQLNAIDGWVELKLNNLETTTWIFSKLGYISTSANNLSQVEQLGVGQVSFEYVNLTKGLTIGQSYKGGKIAYLDTTRQHGLIAAQTDQSSGIQWWNGSYVATGTTGVTIGTGQVNTTAIVNAQGAGSYAAKLCDDLVLNGYTDWYLPSKDELIQLYVNKGAIGGFADYYYWSSHEYDSNVAWLMSFYDGGEFDSAKYSKLRVRCVRSF